MGETNRPAVSEKQIRRVVRFLASGPVKVEPSTKPGYLLLSDPNRGAITTSELTCRKMVSRGLAVRANTVLKPTAATKAKLRREMSGNPDFSKQHGDVANKPFRLDNGLIESVEINLAESPLSRLSKMKTRSGHPFLATGEFQAGERLRSDFTRGQMVPRLGIDWCEPTCKSQTRSGSKTDITDTAMSARIRVEEALASVGPELSGVLIDICCFLKGLSDVESERGWPVRSAKVVLKTALASLARHYGFVSVHNETRRTILHWGADDYRPALTR